MALAQFHPELDLLDRLLPPASCIVGVLLSVVPLHMPGLGVATPAFALMALYHWTVYRPDLMHPTTVFAVGIALDALSGTPYVGVSSLAFLIARGMVMLGRRHAAKQGFAFVWAGFFAVTAAAIGVEWLIVSTVETTLLSLRPFIFQILVTVAGYPIFDYLLGQTQRHLMRRAGP